MQGAKASWPALSTAAVVSETGVADPEFGPDALASSSLAFAAATPLNSQRCAQPHICPLAAMVTVCVPAGTSSATQVCTARPSDSPDSFETSGEYVVAVLAVTDVGAPAAVQKAATTISVLPAGEAAGSVISKVISPAQLYDSNCVNATATAGSYADCVRSTPASDAITRPRSVRACRPNGWWRRRR